MSDIAVGSSSVGSDRDLPITIAAKPISTRDRNVALAAIVVLAIIDAIVIPFASVHLPRVDPFIPVLQTVMCAVDLLTAALLFAQYSIQPLRCIIAVASGYVFSGLFAFIQTLAFPGAYSPTGIIEDGLNSAAWFFVLWHTTFPLALIVYVFTKESGARLSKGSTPVTITSTLACVLAAAAGLTWLATHATQYLTGSLSKCGRTDAVRCEYQFISMGNEHHGLYFISCSQTHGSRPLANRGFVCMVAELFGGRCS